MTRFQYKSSTKVLIITQTNDSKIDVMAEGEGFGLPAPVDSTQVTDFNECTKRGTRSNGRFIARGLHVAEGVGVEPTIPVRYDGFQDRCNRPLCHPSAIPRIQEKPRLITEALPTAHCTGQTAQFRIVQSAMTGKSVFGDWTCRAGEAL